MIQVTLKKTNMKKCSSCNQRKAKRYCPALASHICSLCCGRLREKEIHCPPDCTYLTQHKPYQEKRIIEKKSAERKGFSHQNDIYNDERLAWLAFHIEVPIKEYADRMESFNDKDVILALEYAKEKVEKGKNLIYFPGESSLPKNEAGEAVYQSLEKCHYEKKVILTETHPSYSKEEKLKCLDRIILSVKTLAKEDFKQRNYIEDLSVRFSKIRELSLQKKIITPT